MIEKIKIEQIELLENLVQLYLHDLSAFFPINFDSTKAKYIYDGISNYFEDENFKPFFIKDGNELAGFILISFYEGKYIVQEIFVLNNYKNKGLGKKAIFEVFDMFKGDWEIKAVPLSPNAEMFWTKTVKEYTSNNCNIEYVGKYNRAVLTFNNEIR